jgi:hypothetical protein
VPWGDCGEDIHAAFLSPADAAVNPKGSAIRRDGEQEAGSFALEIKL